MLLIILAIWFGFKKAKATGRNPYLWAAISAGVFIGAQLAVGFGFGIFSAFAQEIWGWSDQKLATYNSLLVIPALLASGIALFLLFRYLDKVPQVHLDNGPPPPPNFSEIDRES